MDNYLLKSHGNNNLLIGDFNDQFINDIYDNINDLDYVDNEQEIINQHDYASNFKDKSNNELNKHCRQNINVNDIQDANSNHKENVKIHQNNVKNIKSIQGNNPEENIKIEDFTILKELLNKQTKQREQEQILLFVAIIGVCIILLINNKH
mgnify:FL=1